MLNSITREQAEISILSVLPSRSNHLARLNVLSDSKSLPVITVIGKYNHGKSRLLNELIGSDAFAVADKRETIKLSEYVHQGVRWLDAPGLDADVENEDDKYAEQAIWLKSDIRLVVHAAKEGEFDSAEKNLAELLLADSEKTHRQTLFVLSQIDQLNDDSELAVITEIIENKMPHLVLHKVSATRHRQGIDEKKILFIDRSGIPTLKEVIKNALILVPAARKHESRILFNELNTELSKLENEQTESLAQLQEKKTQQRKEFNVGLINALDKVAEELEETLAKTGIDHSLVPDAIEDIFNLTAGKLERARLQVAYSRSIKHLSAYLVKQGVIGLPSAQRVAASGLNTVMVAVLGVSVKYRKDLHRIFFEEAGRDRLQKDFTHYYELSDDRLNLEQDLVSMKTALRSTKKALIALTVLDSNL